MLAYSVIAGIAFGIAYWICSTGGASTWRAVVAFVVAQICGWLGGIAIDLSLFSAFIHFDAAATTLSLLGKGFWWSVTGAGYGVFMGRKKLKTTNGTQQSATPKTTHIKASGNDAYAAALAEIEEHRLDKGVWARSFAESGGDESKAKAAYIKARACAIAADAVWVETQPPTADSSRAETAQVSRTPPGDYGLPKWVPAFIAFVLIAGVVGYQQLNNRQTVAANPVQTPGQAEHGPWERYQPQALTKDQFGGTLVNGPTEATPQLKPFTGTLDKFDPSTASQMAEWRTSLDSMTQRQSKRLGIASMTQSVACTVMTLQPTVNPSAARWPGSLPG